MFIPSYRFLVFVYVPITSSRAAPSHRSLSPCDPHSVGYFRPTSSTFCGHDIVTSSPDYIVGKEVKELGCRPRYRHLSELTFSVVV